MEEFIQATDTSLAINKLILDDIEDTAQNGIVLQSIGEKNTQVNDDSVKTKSIGSPPEAKKANMQPGKKQIPASEGTGAPLHPCNSRLNNLEIEQKVSTPKLGGTDIRQNVGSVKDRPPRSHLNVHKQLVQQDTLPIAKEDEGHTTPRYLTALCAAWILLKYARTLPGNATLQGTNGH